MRHGRPPPRLFALGAALLLLVAYVALDNIPGTRLYASLGAWIVKADAPLPIERASAQLHPGLVHVEGDVINGETWTQSLRLLIEARTTQGAFAGRVVLVIYDQPADALAPHERYHFHANWSTDASELQDGSLSLWANGVPGMSPTDYLLKQSQETDPDV